MQVINGTIYASRSSSFDNYDGAQLGSRGMYGLQSVG